VNPTSPGRSQETDPAPSPPRTPAPTRLTTIARDAREPIPLGYLQEPAELREPPMTPWQGIAVALMLLSFPALLVFLWWLAAFI
jgi:hypothetical protein